MALQLIFSYRHHGHSPSKRYILLNIALAALLFVSLFTSQPVFAARFPDVLQGHPNYNAIESLAAIGVITGYPEDGLFHPDRLVNRAETTGMIVRSLQVKPEVGRFKLCFSDVDKQWFAVFVCYGKSERWLSGYPGTTEFRPADNVISVEVLRMVFDGLGIGRIAATTFLKNKWDVPLGFTTLGRDTMSPQWYEDYLVTARESGFLDITPDAAKLMNRAEVAEIIYRVAIEKGLVAAPIGELVTPVSPPVTPTPSVPVTDDTGSSACTLDITKPSHEPTYTAATYCSFDLEQADRSQFWIGKTELPTIPMNFSPDAEDKSWMMALGYASEMFNINPAYLVSVALKESRLNCNYDDGCYQISPVAFSEVKNQYPQYFGFDATHELVQPYATGVVVAALYFRFSEELYAKWYNWLDFINWAKDPEARQAIMSRSFNRGHWDKEIKSMLFTNRTACIDSANFVDECYPQTADLSTPNGIALDHTVAITNYCNRISQSENVYDEQLNRSDVATMIKDTVKPSFTGSPSIDWADVEAHAADVFTCLADENDTISYRYDYKTLLKELNEKLPSLESAQNNIYAKP